MARKPKALVLDTWSVMAYLEDEPAGENVESIIVEAHENGIPLMMTVVNEAEVWYLFARRTSEEGADEAVAELKKLGVEFFEANWKLAHEAAKFKAKNKMSLADCFAAALAKDQKADLATGDLEFKQVEDEIKIAWL
jgi:predicted nucleic acid-binding protein